jgi:hypothetical protein
VPDFSESRSPSWTAAGQREAAVKPGRSLMTGASSTELPILMGMAEWRKCNCWLRRFQRAGGDVLCLVFGINPRPMLMSDGEVVEVGEPGREGSLWCVF